MGIIAKRTELVGSGLEGWHGGGVLCCGAELVYLETRHSGVALRQERGMRTFLISLSAIMLISCGGADNRPEPNSEIAKRCTVMLETDKSTKKSVIEDGIVRDYCNCYADYVAGKSQEDQDLHLAIWAELKSLKTSSRNSELDELQEIFRARVESGDSNFPGDLETFDRIGEDLDDYGRSFRPGAGCPG